MACAANSYLGGPITDSTNITTGRDHVIVTAQFTDGAQQVVLDTWV